MGKGIAGIGVDRLDCCVASGEVVGVRGLDALPVALGGLDQHAVGAHLSDHPTDVSAQLMGHGEFAIDIVQEPHIRNPQHLARSALLCLPDRRHLRSRHVAVDAARVTVGDQAVRHLNPCASPGAHRPSSAEVDVIGMGHDDQESLDPVAVAVMQQGV